jgi:hypothetical protein
MKFPLMAASRCSKNSKRETGNLRTLGYLAMHATPCQAPVSFTIPRYQQWIVARVV